MHTLVILALRRLRQEDSVFMASLGFTVRPCLKKQKEVNTWKAPRCSRGGEWLVYYTAAEMMAIRNWASAGAGGLLL
jgi:hypothetical protein